MTVKELIEQLQQLPPDMPIYAAVLEYDVIKELPFQDDTIGIVEGYRAVIDPTALIDKYQTIEAYLNDR